MKAALIIGALFVLVYILPLGVRPLVTPDESRYAEIPREMLASSDWVVPRLDGMRYFEKPALGYWLTAASMEVFGENAFAARLPSALGTGISALLIGLLIRRFGGGNGAMALAVAVFLTCGQVFAIGVIALLDSALALFVTGALVSFFFAYRSEEPGARAVFLLAFGAMCGFAFLTKGFIAFAVPVVTIVPFLLWERRWRELFRMPWIPMGAAVLVSLPWAIMIHGREGDFWHYFFWTEHISRFLDPAQSQHAEPLWFFVPVILAGAMPWTCLAPAAISGLRRAVPRDPLIRFALCWLVFPFVFFSLSSGKLGTYVLPCFPGLAILISLGLLEYFRREGRNLFMAGSLAIVAVSVTALVVFVLIHTTDVFGMRLYGAGEQRAWWFALIGIAALGTLAGYAAVTSRDGRRLALLCLAPATVLFFAHFIYPAEAAPDRIPGGFLMSEADKVGKGDAVVADPEIVHAVCWFYKRSDVFLLGSGGEMDYGLTYPETRGRKLDADGFKALIEASGSNGVVLIAHTEVFDRWIGKFPEPALVVNGRGLVLARYAGPARGP